MLCVHLLSGLPHSVVSPDTVLHGDGCVVRALQSAGGSATMLRLDLPNGSGRYPYVWGCSFTRGLRPVAWTNIPDWAISRSEPDRLCSRVRAFDHAIRTTAKGSGVSLEEFQLDQYMSPAKGEEWARYVSNDSGWCLVYRGPRAGYRQHAVGFRLPIFITPSGESSVTVTRRWIWTTHPESWPAADVDLVFREQRPDTWVAPRYTEWHPPSAAG